MKKVLTLIGVLGALVITLTLTGGGDSALAKGPSAPPPAKVRVGHGIPGQDLGLAPALPVDVLVNDSICLLQGFTFGEFAGPVNLAAGTYNIKVSVANSANPCSEAAVINADVPFAAGEDATVLAHLSESGAPTASKFVNDVSRPGFLKSRVSVHHTAAAPTVDVTLQRPYRFTPAPKLTIEDVSNGDQAAATVFLGRWNVSISPANTSTSVFDAALTLKPGRVYLAYAVGTVGTDSFTVLTQEISTR